MREEKKNFQCDRLSIQRKHHLQGEMRSQNHRAAFGEEARRKGWVLAEAGACLTSPLLFMAPHYVPRSWHQHSAQPFLLLWPWPDFGWACSGFFSSESLSSLSLCSEGAILLGLTVDTRLLWRFLSTDSTRGQTGEGALASDKPGFESGLNLVTWTRWPWVNHLTFLNLSYPQEDLTRKKKRISPNWQDYYKN